MKKLLLVSLLFVQSLWAAAAADGGAQQIGSVNEIYLSHSNILTK